MDSTEEVFLTVLHPSSVQLIYQIRNNCKYEVRALTGANLDLLAIHAIYVPPVWRTGLANSVGRRTTLLRMPQQVTSGWS